MFNFDYNMDIPSTGLLPLHIKCFILFCEDIDLKSLCNLSYVKKMSLLDECSYMWEQLGEQVDGYSDDPFVVQITDNVNDTSTLPYFWYTMIRFVKTVVYEAENNFMAKEHHLLTLYTICKDILKLISIVE